jgi:hypothetical protein
MTVSIKVEAVFYYLKLWTQAEVPAPVKLYDEF